MADNTIQISLLELARQHFTNDLTVAEEKMFRAAAEGAMADCLPAASDKKNLFITGTNDDVTAHADLWSTNRIVRANRLAWLCTDAEASKLVSYRGVGINGARIEGYVYLARANMNFAMFAQNCVFTNDIYLNSAHLQGLYLDGSKIKNLFAEGLRVDGNIFMDNGFKALGLVNLRNSTIGQNLICNGGQFLNSNNFAINASEAQIEGNVLMGDGFVAQGLVAVSDSSIGHVFYCDNGQFLNSNNVAIVASSAQIEGNVFMGHGFLAQGAVGIKNVSIGGEFICSGGKFLNPGNGALTASGAKIEHGVSLCTNFLAKGFVDFSSASIGGDFDCNDGQFVGASGLAITANSARIGGSVKLASFVSAEGMVSLVSATVGNFFFLGNSDTFTNTRIDLSSAKIGTLYDLVCPLRPGNLILDGLTYDHINHDSPLDVNRRIQWLRLQPANDFSTQPYEQLAKVLSSMGHEDDAAEVMIAKGHDYARTLHWTELDQWPECFWYKIFGRFIGYGYKTWRAFALSLLFIGLGYGIFRFGRNQNLILPTDEKDWSLDKEGHPQVSANYPRFSNFIYSLEVFLPLVKLGMDDNWRPYANRQTQIQVGKKSVTISGQVVRCYFWLHIMAGWVLSTLWIGGLTGLVKT
jgi:hypothetical protein